MNKVYIAKNIALLQINVKSGVDEYYLAKNVDWQNEKIDKIIMFAPVFGSSLLSPIDGTTPVLERPDLECVYLDLYAKDEHTICNGMSAMQIMHTNNHPFIIGSDLQFNLSRLFFSDAPTQDGCILLYVFYSGKEEIDYELPQKNITIKFPLAANAEITFTELINTYLHAPAENVKGISFWNADLNTAYVTLRDHQNKYVIHNLATPLMRPTMVGTDAEDTQIMPMLFDNIDIDFDNSVIRNAEGVDNTQTMTIKY